MILKLDGLTYVELLRFGIRNLEKHRTKLNDLNVFPVPDGDTGTNMVMTLRSGFDALKNKEGNLSDLARQFASHAVYGARGNSGVIVSQFFKGLSEGFAGAPVADSELLSKALTKGCEFAYASVSRPVEGTMLTVIKDASRALADALPLENIDMAIDVFLAEARRSLARTPDLLPILKKANVVDSGGSGIVCFFEGVQKFLRDEEIESAGEETASEQIDLSLFNKDTTFPYGYCLEGLIQLRCEGDAFDKDAFLAKISPCGNSIVTSIEGDKLKLHIHTKLLGHVIALCQGYGEFLTMKVENMTVQNMQKEHTEEKERKFLYDPDREVGHFAVVAVASNPTLQRQFFDMGADVVILSDIAPSSQDFLDAFALVAEKEIMVFPNSANSILGSMQAGSLYKKARVTVLNCRSMTECYATLPALDYEGEMADVVAMANDILSGMYQLSIYHAVKEVQFGATKIHKNDFFALSGDDILSVKDSLEAVTLDTINLIVRKQEWNVMTLFYGKNISPEYITLLAEKINAQGYDFELATVATEESAYDITLAFE